VKTVRRWPIVENGIEVRQSSDETIRRTTTRYKWLAEANESLYGSALYGKFCPVYAFGDGQAGWVDSSSRRGWKILRQRGDREDNSDVCS